MTKSGEARTENVTQGERGIHLLFVGGTGRSGTTILARSLGMQPEWYDVPMELRFITDPDGLMSLRRALVDDWSPYQIDVALHRFTKLMQRLKRRFGVRYPTTGLARFVGANRYDRAVDRFLREIQAFQFRGAWAGRTNVLQKALLRYAGWRKDWYGPAIPCVRFGPDLAAGTFGELARALVKEMLDGCIGARGVKWAVEHTPTNFLHAEFLLATWPEARLVHVVRDPRDVVASLRRQDWAPSRVARAASVVNAVLARWERVREQIPAKRVMEVRFEDFIARPVESLSRILAFTGDCSSAQAVAIDLSRHNIGRWRGELSPRELGAIMRQPAIRRSLERWGYVTTADPDSKSATGTMP